MRFFGGFRFRARVFVRGLWVLLEGSGFRMFWTAHDPCMPGTSPEDKLYTRTSPNLYTLTLLKFQLTWNPVSAPEP